MKEEAEKTRERENKEKKRGGMKKATARKVKG